MTDCKERSDRTIDGQPSYGKKVQHRKLSKKQVFKRSIFVFIGVVLEAVALETFLVPNGIIDGGIVGISIMLSHLTHIQIGIFLFLLNMPFCILGYKQMGKTFTVTSILAITALSIFTALLVPVPKFTGDYLLAAVFGGVLLGIGVGLVVRNGGSSDGTEILAVLTNKTSPFSVGETVMFVNIFILASAGFVFGWNNAMYSLIAYFIAFKMIDITVEGLESSRSVWIISNYPEEIGSALNDRLGRGITYLNGAGYYSGDDKQVIFIVITRLEEAKLKNIVEDIDSKAFLAFGDIHDVKGGRFKKQKIH
ncbi:YitT family protein [Tuberibacillus sp. Marseille-P3662]|uniref:YitT family protein n=1 Tax=Tuberibacillus sp. Marseille-P3662 TaxID=1965358 RepID=UPI000A1C9091|nr:YitT family protein [Tuberibacillus sp. Marseille-P3662]